MKTSLSSILRGKMPLNSFPWFRSCLVGYLTNTGNFRKWNKDQKKVDNQVLSTTSHLEVFLLAVPMLHWFTFVANLKEKHEKLDSQDRIFTSKNSKFLQSTPPWERCSQTSKSCCCLLGSSGGDGSAWSYGKAHGNSAINDLSFDYF